MTTYKVSGETAYMDHQPGDEFEADLDPFLEQAAIDNGWLEVSKTKAKKEAQADG